MKEEYDQDENGNDFDKRFQPDQVKRRFNDGESHSEESKRWKQENKDQVRQLQDIITSDDVKPTDLDSVKQELAKSLERMFSFEEKMDSELKEIEARFDALQEQTQEISKRAEARVTEYEDTLEKTKDLQQQTKQIHEETQSLKKTASNLIKREAGASIGSEFAERRNELENSLLWWKGGALASIIMLLIASTIIYQDISSTTVQGFTVVSKVALLLPISVAVWFTASHYGQQRKLMEEYEFKANIALSLMGFREILREELPEEERERTGDFVVDTMEKIYSDPIAKAYDSENQQGGVRPTQGQSSLTDLIYRFGNE